MERKYQLRRDIRTVEEGDNGEKIPTKERHKNGRGRRQVERKYLLNRDIRTVEEGDKWRENTN